MTEFETTTPTNNASCGLPDTSTRTNSVSMIALTTVNTLAATIWPNDRPGGSGVTLTRPAATRSATSAALSPGPVAVSTRC